MRHSPRPHVRPPEVGAVVEGEDFARVDWWGAELDGVTFTLAPASALAILGPTGAGKSSILDAVCFALPRALPTRRPVELSTCCRPVWSPPSALSLMLARPSSDLRTASRYDAISRSRCSVSAGACARSTAT